MALILNIDTATEGASVCISNDGVCLSIKSNDNQKEHASFVHVAIQELVYQSGSTLNNLDAIAVTIGPGSYTGIRVGLATAKGLCYALNKPLIGVNTLMTMARAGIDKCSSDMDLEQDALFCPMIDARRMEVFAAIYRANLEVELAPAAMHLELHTFDNWQHRTLYCFGSGSKKVENIAGDKMQIVEVKHSAEHLGYIADEMYNKGDFASLSMSTPEYLKEFFTTATN